MVSFVQKIIPTKVKTKLLTTLGVLITLMVAVPSILSYRSTLEYEAFYLTISLLKFLRDCHNKEYSMFGNEGYCWEEAGSAAATVECPKIISGEYSSCSECKGVFRSAVRDEFSELNVYMHSFIANVRYLVKDVNGNCTNLNQSSQALAKYRPTPAMCIEMLKNYDCCHSH